VLALPTSRTRRAAESDNREIVRIDSLSAAKRRTHWLSQPGTRLLSVLRTPIALPPPFKGMRAHGSHPRKTKLVPQSSLYEGRINHAHCRSAQRSDLFWRGNLPGFLQLIFLALFFKIDIHDTVFDQGVCPTSLSD